MGPLIIFVVIVVVMAAIIIGWAMVLRFQRQKKISDLKVTYLRLASEEQNAYHRYIQAEKALQEQEMEMQNLKDIIKELKKRIVRRRKEIREVIPELKIIRSKMEIVRGGDKKLDLELKNTQMTGDIRAKLALNNEDKHRLLTELSKLREKNENLPYQTEEAAQLSNHWETLRSQLEELEQEFKTMDRYAWQKFSDAFIRRSSDNKKIDPERELVNMIILLNSKKGLLYARKKEQAKDPTTETAKQIKKAEKDVAKLETQLAHKAKNLGVTAKRLEELKNLFLNR